MAVASDVGSNMSKNPTQTTASTGESDGDQSVDECPACGGSELDTSSGIPAPICTTCGVAVGTSADPQIPLNDSNEEGGTTSNSWTTYYSVTNSTEQQIATALEEVEAVRDELSLSAEIRSRTADVYASAAIENLTDGRRTRLTVAAAVCIGSREVGYPRPTERVARAANLEAKNVKRALRCFQEELDRGFTETPPASYVPFLCSDTELGSEIETEAVELVQELPDAEQRGVHPVGIAGAAIYLAADGDVTQRTIAEIAGVTKETIRVRLADFRSEVVE